MNRYKSHIRYTDEYGSRCEYCLQDWPCDAVERATYAATLRDTARAAVDEYFTDGGRLYQKMDDLRTAIKTPLEVALADWDDILTPPIHPHKAYQQRISALEADLRAAAAALQMVRDYRAMTLMEWCVKYGVWGITAIQELRDGAVDAVLSRPSVAALQEESKL